MGRKKNEEVDVMEAMEEVEGAIESAEAPQEEEKPVYVLTDGSETQSRAEFIRDQFLNLNKTRKAISEEFDFSYQSVYQATTNLTNDAESTSGGRSHVTIEVDGETVGRTEFIQKLAEEEGMNRKDIQTKLQEITGEEVAYQVVYNATKDIDGMGGSRGGRVMVEVDGEEIPRTEYIKRRHKEGASISDIRKELDVSYQVVYAVVGAKNKAKVTIKASSVEELDKQYEEARKKLLEEEAKEAEEEAAE